MSADLVIALAWTVQGVYALTMACLSLFALHRLQLVWLFRKHWRADANPDRFESRDHELPSVTVQLPVRNERYVVERLIRAACALGYPRDRLEIQVLDDSDDDTTEIAARVVAELRSAGHRIDLLRRRDRVGFKAGALAFGLERASGELIAIFDADFVPPPDLLWRLEAPFRDPTVAMVQARWSHLNRDYALLTRLQAVLLDGHFVVEHTARHLSGKFFNFNGTAGMWRRRAIEDAGGWQHDTLTEDLDLSYRAQLRGWRFVYLPTVTVPGELPVEMAGLRSQQHRWAMGSAQTARKLLRPLLGARLPWRVKLEAVVHLCGNVSYVMTTLLAVLLVPSLATRELLALPRMLWLDLPLLAFGTGSVLTLYAVSQSAFDRAGWRRWSCLPLALGLGVALALHNSSAVIRGWTGERGVFRRTPKYGVASSADTWTEKRYRLSQPWPWPDLVLMVSNVGALWVIAERQLWGALPFVCLFTFGYGFSAFRSLTDRRRLNGRSTSPPPRIAARRLGRGTTAAPPVAALESPVR